MKNGLESIQHNYSHLSVISNKLQKVNLKNIYIPTALDLQNKKIIQI